MKVPSPLFAVFYFPFTCHMISKTLSWHNVIIQGNGSENTKGNNCPFLTILEQIFIMDFIYIVFFYAQDGVKCTKI